ncbi:MAG TPA: glycosyl hydrolase [Thermoleophilaceae bacterium]
MRWRRRRRFTHWGAVAAVAAVAAALPFLGGWAEADRQQAPRAAAPAAEPAPAEPKAQPRPGRSSPGPPRRPRPDTGLPKRVAIGAFIPGGTQRPSLIERYARHTGRPPAILLYFRTWRRGRVFDRLTLRRVAAARAVPLVTWEPSNAPLRDIAKGRYDAYLRSSARDAARWTGPIMVRFAHEMNGDWYSWGSHANSPRTFVRAWRRLVRIFRQEGALNVRFVWTPNAESGQLRLIRRLYPGDKWVDWVGLSGFSWGGPWDWVGPRDIFRPTYRAITRMTKRPFMIAETGAGELGGDKAEWIRWMFRDDLPRMRRIRAVVWFNGREKWADFDVESSRESLRAFRTAVAAPRYSGTAADVELGG